MESAGNFICFDNRSRLMTTIFGLEAVFSCGDRWLLADVATVAVSRGLLAQSTDVVRAPDEERSCNAAVPWRRLGENFGVGVSSVNVFSSVYMTISSIEGKPIKTSKVGDHKGSTDGPASI